MSVRATHFISGLPRSGSTLLGALLRQNPRFSAGVTSPLAMLYGSVLHGMSGATEFASFFDDRRREAILKGMFHAYYHEAGDGRVVFDTNRGWTARLPLVAALFPEARVICCVREIGWILDSIERLVRANAMRPTKLFNWKSGGSVYSRVDAVMDPEKGLVGSAWSGLREAWFSEMEHRLVVVNYDSLAREPERVMRGLYEALGEAPFAHDFDRVVYEEAEYDTDLGLPGLHRVRPRVAHLDRGACIPPDLFGKYADTAFWKNPKLNARGVTVL